MHLILIVKQIDHKRVSTAMEVYSNFKASKKQESRKPTYFQEFSGLNNS